MLRNLLRLEEMVRSEFEGAVDHGLRQRLRAGGEKGQDCPLEVVGEAGPCQCWLQQVETFVVEQRERLVFCLECSQTPCAVAGER